MSSLHVSLGEVAAALALAALAIAVSASQRARLEREISLAAARAFVQLTAVGYVVKVGFEQDRLALVVALLAAMTVVGALTARRRAAAVPGAFWPLLIALALAAAAATLGLVVGLGILVAQPRYLVPVGGMVIGNAMIAAAVALNRLGDDIRAEAPRIEATLALGAPARDALRPVVRRSLRSGLIPLIDSTKTTGLVFFPGTMVGMLLAGAAPVEAVRLQLVLLNVVLGSVALAALVAVTLAQRRLITPAHQLRELAPTPT